MYYLGIDGGGTKTAFEVINDKGDILALVQNSTCDYLQIGMENYGRIIEEGAAAVCEAANISLSDIHHFCIGIPNLGETAADTPKLISIAKKALHSDSVKCVNDVEVAWAGSLACEPGINILAGTGSIGFGVDQKNNAARAGGWGDFFGDEGSAYWLAKKLIELFTKQADGRLQKDRTYDIVCRKFGLTSDFDFISVIYDKLKLKRDEIAGLQLLLYEAAVQGDSYAVDMYRQAAYELSLIIMAIIGQLSFNECETIAVSYSGGVFKAGDLILKPLREYLGGSNITMKEPLLSPVSGAALSALLAFGCNFKNDVVSNLYRQERNSK